MPFHAPPKGTAGNPYDGHALAQIIPAIEQLVGNEIERLYSADVGAHSHAKPSESGSRCNGPNKKWQLPGR
jgi:hypothetical protein